MPNRMLKAGIIESDQINQLSWFEEVLFYRLIVSADDYGCMDGRPEYLKSILFPLKGNVTVKAVNDAIAKLASVGLIVPYADASNGKPYLFFPTWEKHQRLRNKHRKYPEPPNGLTDICQSNDGQMTVIRPLELELELELEEHPPKSPLKGDGLSFDSFWEAYPRKVAKQDAVKAFRKLTVSEREQILPALERQKKGDLWTRDGGKYIPYPATWLNGKRWEDEDNGEHREHSVYDGLGTIL